jgi:type VI secretion system protein VasD
MLKTVQTIFLCIVTALLLTGCASNSVNPELTVSSTATLNSQGNNHPVPVQIQIYSLREYADFNKASFFDIYDTPRKALGTDLVNKTDKIIVPASSLIVPLKLTKDVQYIGVLVAFTKLRPEEDWRFVIPIEQLSNVKQILLNDNQMTVELVDPEKPIILGKADVAEAPEGDNFSLDDMKKKGEELQSAKDDFSADKLKEKYSEYNPLNKTKGK